MDITKVMQGERGGWIVNDTISVPDVEGNRHADLIQEWIAEGNVVEPFVAPKLGYRDRRRREYPPLDDQLDVVWKQFNQMRLNGEDLIQEADDMLGGILAVKARHPKGG